MCIVKYITQYLTIGKHLATTLTEEKRVTLLNAGCIIWLLSIVGLITLGFLLEPRLISTYSLTTFSIHSLILLAIIWIQSKGSFLTARIFFISSGFLSFITFEHLVLPGASVKFYFIIPVLLSQLFFDNKKVHYSILILSILLFYNFFLVNDNSLLGSLHFVNYFVALFFIVDVLMATNKTAEQKLEKQKEEIEEFSRFQNKFFVHISHELRTPITLINGTTEQLLNSEIENKRSNLNIIFDQSNKMKQIVDDVLDMSKMKHDKLILNKKSINLNQLINNLYISFLPSFQEKNINLLLEESDLNHSISGDSVFLERAINNILLNSLKFTDKGSVSIYISQKETDKVCLHIDDTGTGIPAKDLPHILKQYYQADNDINKAGGSGIGLAFVQNIIKLHEGTIKITSIHKEGTQVNIYLPLVSTQKNELNYINTKTTETITYNKKTKNIKETNKTILLIDDHKEMRAYISSILINYKVIEAANGLEALELLDSHKIDFIITDYMMPKMDGYEFIKSIKSNKINTPILVLTARTDMKGKLDTLKLGIDDYITKPFNKEELLIRIEKSLSNHLSREEYRSEQQIEVEEASSTTSTDPFLNDLKEYIEENCSDHLFGLDQICETFALSTSSLYRKIKLSSGMSSNAFVREVKLQLARELINSSKVSSLKELSHRIGFNKPSYLSSIYLQRFGKKPFAE